MLVFIVGSLVRYAKAVRNCSSTRTPEQVHAWKRMNCYLSTFDARAKCGKVAQPPNHSLHRLVHEWGIPQMIPWKKKEPRVCPAAIAYRRAVWECKSLVQRID